MKIYLIAGEASGDLHGANLIAVWKKEAPATMFRCWGGDLMEAAGATLVRHYRELAFMGFWEVIKNLPAITRNFRQCKTDIAAWKPDAVILIDYPGFNLRMAKWIKTNGIRVFYYISPQLWAWHSSRVKIVRKYIDRMFVILPFEKEFYAKHGVEVDFMGHPLPDVIAGTKVSPDFLVKNKLPADKPVIALLPGSRRQEIARMLKIMLQVAPNFPGHHFAIAGAPAIEREFYQTYTGKYPEVSLVENQTYALLQHAKAALVTSGTATLETALFGVPQVVCYKGGWLSYLLARWLVNKDLQFIAMVNLIAGKKVVTELIQGEMTPAKLTVELERILSLASRTAMLEEYKAIREKLGKAGASDRAARRMIQLMHNQVPRLKDS